VSSSTYPYSTDTTTYSIVSTTTTSTSTSTLQTSCHTSYTRRPKDPTVLPPHLSSSASPATPVLDECNNIDESNAIFDESQVTPRYNLRNRNSIEPPDRLGFPCVIAVIAEPSTYREASIVPQWQSAMAEELNALDRTSTWDIVPLPPNAVPITC
jgi:hypothetical protein